jgi:hypothetical protein
MKVTTQTVKAHSDKLTELKLLKYLTNIADCRNS